MKTDAKSTIETGKAILGIEFGSTRIKAVLIDPENHPIAQGSHTWENQLVDGLWTYSIEEIWYGLQDCYADLRANVKKQYDTEIETLAAIGVSAMMHGYMAFDKNEEILVPFRTWRNTNTGQAAAALSELFVYNIPLRWSISHLYQAILNNEKHVNHSRNDQSNCNDYYHKKGHDRHNEAFQHHNFCENYADHNNYLSGAACYWNNLRGGWESRYAEKYQGDSPNRCNTATVLLRGKGRSSAVGFDG